MLTKEQIESIKSGVPCVTRMGYKAIYIGYEPTDEYDKYPHAVLVIEGLLKDAEIEWYDDNLCYNSIDNSYDIVGLWEDKPEPFNLERALAGEPVKLKNGEMGFILHNIESLMYSNYPLIGVDSNGEPLHWDKNGICGSGAIGGELNIIGMWKESKQIEPSVDGLPKPIREFRYVDKAYVISRNDCEYVPRKVTKRDGWTKSEQRWFENGLCYASEMDCQMMCRWLMNR